jgi:hypothetical protein
MVEACLHYIPFNGLRRGRMERKGKESKKV